jgi:hypothetical protein
MNDEKLDFPTGKYVNVILYLRKVDGKFYCGFVTDCSPRFKDRMRQIVAALVREDSDYFVDHKKSKIFYYCHQLTVLKDNMHNYPKSKTLTRFKDREIDYDIPNLLESKSLKFSKKMLNFCNKMIAADDYIPVDPDSTAISLVDSTLKLELEAISDLILNDSSENMDSKKPQIEVDDQGLSRSSTTLVKRFRLSKIDAEGKAKKLCERFNIQSTKVFNRLTWLLTHDWVRDYQIKIITNKYLLLNEPLFGRVIGDVFDGLSQFGSYIHKKICVISRLSVESFRILYGA